jgi:hypothetical protein
VFSFKVDDEGVQGLVAHHIGCGRDVHCCGAAVRYSGAGVSAVVHVLFQLQPCHKARLSQHTLCRAYACAVQYFLHVDPRLDDGFCHRLC